MLRPCVAAALALMLAGCANSLRSKEKVQAAILKRLETRSGLTTSELDITTTSVRFDKNLAFATVAIHPKADTDVSKGMSMRYTLEARDGQWVVLDPIRSHGAAPGSPAPGHGTSDEPLPTGHPGLRGPESIPNPHQPSSDPGSTATPDGGAVRPD